jgi:hypothetical protein
MQGTLELPQIEYFIHQGFIRIDNAFSTAIAAQVRDILWNDTGCNPHDPATWTRPVVRLGMYTQAPFIEAGNTAVLQQAFDQLVGKNKWSPCRSMGTFPIRFPSPEDPGDTGWHVDASFPGMQPDNYMEWRINVQSRGRALLMLFLFSDVGIQDAPTRIRIGSHLDVARLLKPEGEKGLSMLELAAKLSDLPHQKEVLATGKAGTVYLCHPFLVHAAQWHNGTEPRFMAQPPLLFKDYFNPVLDLNASGNNVTPIEQAIKLALENH